MSASGSEGRTGPCEKCERPGALCECLPAPQRDVVIVPILDPETFSSGDPLDSVRGYQVMVPVELGPKQPRGFNGTPFQDLQSARRFKAFLMGDSVFECVAYRE